MTSYTYNKSLEKNFDDHCCGFRKIYFPFLGLGARNDKKDFFMFIGYVGHFFTS